MNDSRLPKICFLRSHSLRASFNSSRHNWVQQFNEFLININESHMLNNLDLGCWKSRKEDLLCKYTKNLKCLDLERYKHSSACQLRLPTPLYKVLANFDSTPHHLLKPLSQMRLASNLACKISVNRAVIKFSPLRNFSLCHLEAKDSIRHFLLVCPFYSDVRLKFWDANSPLDHYRLSQFL